MLDARLLQLRSLRRSLVLIASPDETGDAEADPSPLDV